MLDSNCLALTHSLSDNSGYHPSIPIHQLETLKGNWQSPRPLPLRKADSSPTVFRYTSFVRVCRYRPSVLVRRVLQDLQSSNSADPKSVIAHIPM